MYTRLFKLSALMLLGSLGCGSSGSTSPKENLGRIALAITNAPSDGTCIQVLVSSVGGAVERDTDVTPGQSTLLQLSALPLGLDTIVVNAYSGSCGALTGASIPTWVGNPVVVMVTEVPTSVSVVLHPNQTGGRLTLGVDFQANAPEGGVVDAAEPDGATFDAAAEPDAATAEPDAATAEPDAATAEPDAATAEPDAATAEPDAATAEPDAIGSVASRAAPTPPIPIASLAKATSITGARTSWACANPASAASRRTSATRCLTAPGPRTAASTRRPTATAARQTPPTVQRAWAMAPARLRSRPVKAQTTRTSSCKD